jgi:hypothetical protein
MKRQRGRGRPGGNQGGNGGGKPPQNANRAFESNGPDGVKIRGHAQHVFEKYQQLARDASSSGDRVLAENYLQHAEHYFRVLRAVQPHRTAAEILGRDSIASGFDIDFEDETGEDQADAQEVGQEAGQGGEARQDQRHDQGRNDQARQEQSRRDRERSYNRDRNERQPDNRQPDQAGDGERYQGERPQGERQERRERPQRPYRDDRRERYEPREQGEQRADPLAIVEPQSTPLTQDMAEPVSSPVLRSEDGSTSHAPAFLQSRSEPIEEAAVAKPRRRRVPRATDAGESASASDGTDET